MTPEKYYDHMWWVFAISWGDMLVLHSFEDGRRYYKLIGPIYMM